MINPKELRIGNYFLVNGRTERVIFITEHEVNGMEGYLLQQADPIPLTEEILTKNCGFESDDNVEFYSPKNEDFDLMFSISANRLWCAYTFGETNYGPFEEFKKGPPSALPICNPFKYLHQLQNLYFALTGEELNVKF